MQQQNNVKAPLPCRLGPVVQAKATETEDPKDVVFPSAHDIFMRKLGRPLMNAGVPQEQIDAVLSVFMGALAASASPDHACFVCAPVMNGLWAIGCAGWARSVFTSEVVCEFLGGRDTTVVAGFAEHINRVGAAWAPSTRDLVAKYAIEMFKRLRGEPGQTEATAARFVSDELDAWAYRGYNAALAQVGTGTLRPFETWMFNAWCASERTTERPNNPTSGSAFDEALRRLKAQVESSKLKANARPQVRASR